MPAFRVPKMCLHKARNRAVVRLCDRDYYLGAWGSDEAKAEYDRLITEWLSNGRRAPAHPSDIKGNQPAAGFGITELLAAFWQHAELCYRGPYGQPTGELNWYRDSLRPLRRLYGHTLVRDFGPLALKAVRDEMIATRSFPTPPPSPGRGGG